MENKRFDDLQKDVAAHFPNPAAILEDHDLDAEQKAALLKQWEYDLRQMMVASEENMTDQSSGGTGKSAETLQGVRLALHRLAEDNPDAAGKADKEAGGQPAKAGGSVN